MISRKKRIVGDCLRLSMTEIKADLIKGMRGVINLSFPKQSMTNIGYEISGNQQPETIGLTYKTIGRSGVHQEMDYPVSLLFTPLPWGKNRYWFACPMEKNGGVWGKRVAILYLPPGEFVFGCRHCYDLTYRSSQTAHCNIELGQYSEVVDSQNLENINPEGKKTGLEPQDMANQHDLSRPGESPDNMYPEGFDRNPGYLDLGQLCLWSGLTYEEQAILHDARLLVPDRKDGLYRPKLVLWAEKLKYLLDEGWTIPEIKAWAAGRFKAGKPYIYPPIREDWQT